MKEIGAMTEFPAFHVTSPAQVRGSAPFSKGPHQKNRGKIGKTFGFLRVSAIFAESHKIAETRSKSCFFAIFRGFSRCPAQKIAENFGHGSELLIPRDFL